MKIIVSGATGRMGKELKTIISNSDDLKLYGEIHRESSPENIEAPDAEMVIDFSLPENFSGLIKFCTKNKIPLVSGTTGLEPKHLEAFAALGTIVPVLWAPNMSVGINLMNEIIKHLDTLGSGFDFQIEETHHREKEDKPSGTALLLQNTLEKAVGTSLPEVLSIRGGGVYGIHTVTALSDSETISIKHTALNRSVFAKGAVRAARWLTRQTPGQYKMADMLGFNK